MKPRILFLIMLLLISFQIMPGRLCFGGNAVFQRISDGFVECDMSGLLPKTSLANGLIVNETDVGLDVIEVSMGHASTRIRNFTNMPLRTKILLWDRTNVVGYAHVATNLIEHMTVFLEQRQLTDLYPLFSQAIRVVDGESGKPVTDAVVVYDGNSGITGLTRTLLDWQGVGEDKWITSSFGMATLMYPAVNGGKLKVRISPPVTQSNVYEPISLGLEMRSSTNVLLEIALPRKPVYIPVHIKSSSDSEYELAACSLFLRSEHMQVVIYGDQKTTRIPPPGVYRITAMARIGNDSVPIEVSEADQVLTVPKQPNLLKQIVVHIGKPKPRIELTVGLTVTQVLDQAIYPYQPILTLVSKNDGTVQNLVVTNAITTIRNLTPNTYTLRLSSPYIKTAEMNLDLNHRIDAEHIQIKMEWKKSVFCKVEGVANDIATIQVVSARGLEYTVEGKGRDGMRIFVPDDTFTRFVWRIAGKEHVAYGSFSCPRDLPNEVVIDALEAKAVHLHIGFDGDILESFDPVRVYLHSLGTSSMSADAQMESWNYTSALGEKGIKLHLASGQYLVEVRLLGKGMVPKSPHDFVSAIRQFKVVENTEHDIELLFDKRSFRKAE